MITLKEAREHFDYRDGVLYWKKKLPHATNISIGCKAGSVEPIMKYIRIKFKGKCYLRSRLVFLWHHGRWPEPECDHIDKNRQNDKIENLREASHSLNMINRKLKSRSGFAHINKIYKKKYKQGFIWGFRLVKNGEMKWIKGSANLDKLLIFRNKWLQKNDPERWAAVQRFEK